MKASDNEFPSILTVEQASAPATPASGNSRIYVDDTDHLLRTVDDTGNVTTYSVLTNAGTSFPVSPTTSDRFFRTDLGMEFYYDGTRWVSVQLLEIRVTGDVAMPISAAASFRAAAPILVGTDFLLVKTQTWFFVSGGTALSASHKWVGTVRTSPSVTTLDTVTVNSGASDTHRQSTATTINAALGTTDFELETVWAKTGTPGTLYTQTVISFRHIAT